MRRGIRLFRTTDKCLPHKQLASTCAKVVPPSRGGRVGSEILDFAENPGQRLDACCKDSGTRAGGKWSIAGCLLAFAVSCAAKRSRIRLGRHEQRRFVAQCYPLSRIKIVGNRLGQGSWVKRRFRDIP